MRPPLSGRPQHSVAGVGVEPTPEGYEPSEVPFLYPAINKDTVRTNARQYTAENDPKQPKVACGRISATILVFVAGVAQFG